MIKILVICTGNSCRSVIGEALLNHFGNGWIQAFSAGSKAKGTINPQAIALLERHGVSTRGLSSKSWDSLSKQQFDIIITVCDRAASETCPSYLNSAVNIHWETIEPSHVKGGNEAMLAAFENTYQIFEQRISRMLALPLGELPAEELITRLNAIN
ncbi:MAG: arsenate reductase ArsC [Gammaproteobacteria bacterium]|nr:MAG: arsenate reductase ArsC [Gammaproteobacteria bacterium]